MNGRPADFTEEQVIWEGRTGWMDHAVLYIFLAAAVVRSAVALQGGQWTTALLYGLATAIFLGIAAWFHYGRIYRLSSTRVQVRSGWNGNILLEMSLKDISDVTLRYELLNRWFDLGVLEIASRTTEEMCTIRGIPYAEKVKTQLDRWIRVQRSQWEPLPAHGTADDAG
jgi:hypothetical protein